ncbi:peptidyl-tRNA hydrolase [Schizophyllum commune Loenen D]|nr:peptidyl-tRNA hydrolase [Schizophyllum commune Loenen D]
MSSLAKPTQLFIAGLGNMTHPATRHSVGQIIMDGLAARLGIRIESCRNGFVGTGRMTLGDNVGMVTLYKTKFPMNLSGPPIVAKMQELHMRDPERLIVIQDSLDHEPLTLSVKKGGSANGHNGVKSTIAALGGKSNFWRLRAGIGRSGGDIPNYVLGRLSNHERTYWREEGIDEVIAAIERIAEKMGSH